MATAAIETFLLALRRSFARIDEDHLTDGELLECFVTRHDGAAFAALMRRHGPMVLGTCRRVLRNEADAEDAFQATFLVLVRKAATIRPQGRVGNWLYGVAHSTALKARAMNIRRSARERAAAAQPKPAVTKEAVEHLQTLLDRELKALPERYRAVIVLCDLEGETIKEAARQLGCPPGTAWSWLSRGRALLSRRLARHGLAVSGGAIAAAVTGDAVEAGVPAHLVCSTIKAVTGVVSARTAALVEGVVKAMFLSKLKIGAGVALVVVLGLGVGTGRLLLPAATGQDNQQRSADQVQQAAAELAAAKAAVAQAEANLAAAQAQAARRRFARADGNTGPVIAAAVIASQFKYRVPVEIGSTETAGGGRIEILEIWGTQPRIKVGGYYLIHGRYTMPAHERGTLYFHESAAGPAGVGPELDLQSTTVRKGQGEFTLMHAMAAPGYFHLHLVGANQKRSETVADVYFGTGDTVLRKK